MQLLLSSGLNMHLCVLLQFWKQAVALVCLTAAFAGYRFAASSMVPRKTAFNDVVDFRHFIRAKGIQLHGGTMHGGICGESFFIADHPIEFDDVAGLRIMRDSGLTHEWTGILWVAQLDVPGKTNFDPADQIIGNWRVWGNVLVAGDEELMNRIEELYGTEEQDNCR
jgi:hypothetical protein